VERLFDLIRKATCASKEFEVKISYLEIYNEQVRDLLVEQGGHLMIVEDPVKGVHVPELKEISVELPEHLMDLILIGNQRRRMASTNSNQFSSRSHAILQITVECKLYNKGLL